MEGEHLVNRQFGAFHSFSTLKVTTSKEQTSIFQIIDRATKALLFWSSERKRKRMHGGVGALLRVDFVAVSVAGRDHVFAIQSMRLMHRNTLEGGGRKEKEEGGGKKKKKKERKKEREGERERGRERERERERERGVLRKEQM